MGPGPIRFIWVYCFIIFRGYRRILTMPSRSAFQRLTAFALLFQILFSPSIFAEEIRLGLSEDELLEVIERKAFDYFLLERNAKTGLIHDQAPNFENLPPPPSVASLAASGFALTAYPIGAERDWIDIGMAREMTLQALRFFAEHSEHEHGFFYHFLNPETGARSGNSEVSAIDTALFLAGALFAAEYFEDSRIRDLAMTIYDRIDWPWFLNKGKTLALAWKPEDGFEKRRWDHYDESMLMYLLAIGSSSHPIPSSAWQSLSRPIGTYQQFRLIQSPPLFTHQYPQIWVDLRDKNDGFADYFKNSVHATLANRAFAIQQASQYRSYGENSWGLTASDGPLGYRAYGAPPGWAFHDGTVAPTACGSSIVFTPKESLACLRYLYENLGDKLWGRYGFSDAFNLDQEWFSPNVIGIDQGALLSMIENYRSGLIWKVMRKNVALQHAMKEVGFKAGTLELEEPVVPEYHAPYVFGGLQIDGYLKDWPNGSVLTLDASSREFGDIEDAEDLKAEMGFAWDETRLYFYAKVTDEHVLTQRRGANIHRDDLLEIFIDSEGDGLRWNHGKDFQLGFRANPEEDSVTTWSWFQGGEDPVEKGGVEASGFVHEKGYQIEGSIRWKYLGILPDSTDVLRISPAIHDVDLDRSESKLQWAFRNEGEAGQFSLGKLTLEKANVRGETL